MKTCVRPGCRQSIATQTPQERNLLVRTKERAARRGVDGDRFPSLDTRSCSKKEKKKKLRITIESDVAYRDTSWLSFGESARVRVDDRNLSINR